MSFSLAHVDMSESQHAPHNMRCHTGVTPTPLPKSMCSDTDANRYMNIYMLPTLLRRGGHICGSADHLWALDFFQRFPHSEIPSCLVTTPFLPPSEFEAGLQPIFPHQIWALTGFSLTVSGHLAFVHKCVSGHLQPLTPLLRTLKVISGFADAYRVSFTEPSHSTTGTHPNLLARKFTSARKCRQ